MTKPITITELPFAFWVADRQDNSALYIVDPDKRYNQRLNVYIENTANQTLFFGPTQLEVKPPSAEHCHFELRFRRGVLADASLGTSTYKGLEKKTVELLLTGKYQKRAYDIGSWVISDPDDHNGEEPYISFYLARAEKGSGGRFMPGERLRLVLTNVSASPEEGSAETRIELVPRNIFYGPPLQEGSAPVVEPREQNVLVINHTGKEHIPLHLAFIGNYTVRNDGQAQGEGHLLRLRITNTSRHDTISFNEKSRMLFAFDYADGDQDEELGTSGNVEKIGFYLKKAYNKQADQEWKQLGSDPGKIKTWLEKYCQAFEAPTPGQQNPIWRLDEDQGLHELQLEPHEHWDVILDTSDFITHSPAGLTPLHITYEDIPGYWDGKLHTEVEKTPLIVRKGTGIHGHIQQKETVEMDSGNRTLYLMGNGQDGSANNHARLHVKGRTFVDGKFVATGETELRSDLKVSGNLAGLGKELSVNSDATFNNNVNIHQKLTAKQDVQVDGKLGIGTNAPKAKLDLHGGDLRMEADGLAAGLSCEKNKLINLEVNFRIQSDEEDNGGAAFRIDRRDNQPLFNWMNREKPAADQQARDTMLMELSRQGDLKVKAGRIQDKTGDVMPVGAIIAYGGQNIPEGWLECNGQYIGEKNEFKELRDALGKLFVPKDYPHPKDNIDNNYYKAYTVPDLRSRFIVGVGQGEGLSNYQVSWIGGEEKHALIVEEMPPHNHKFTAYKANFKHEGKATESQIKDDGDGSFDYWTDWTGGEKKYGAKDNPVRPHNNLPPYYALRYIIKY